MSTLIYLSVTCHLSFVIDSHKWKGLSLSGASTDGLQVCVQLGSEFLGKRLYTAYLLRIQELADIRTSQPVSSFVQRASGSPNKTSIVLIGSPSRSFSNVGPDAIC